MTGSGTVWNMSTITNFSYTGSGRVKLTYAGAVNSIITPGAASAAQALNFFVTAGTYGLTLSTGGAVNNLDFTSDDFNSDVA